MSSTNITSPFLLSIANVKFTGSKDVNDYFASKTNATFINWFNANIALRENWGNVGNRSGIKMMSDADTQNRFNALWNQIPIIFGTSSINLLQFVSLMSIVNNETGGSIKPITERVGNKDNPFLAYAFNRISGIKKSYNTLTSNKTAYDLFHDAKYKQQHGHLAMGNSLADTPNIAWKGEMYPVGVPNSLDEGVTGFIQETDFYKFRGRGFIQTTTRGNYSQLGTFIFNYKGTNAVINQYKTKWQGQDADTIATISSNLDWDTLFQNTDLIIPSAAIFIHNKSAGNYLNKITLQTTADLSIRNMGKAISGANDYADLFQKRVIQILDGLGN
jgi:hypothetical protein